MQPPFSLRGRAQAAAGGGEERLTFICSFLALFLSRGHGRLMIVPLIVSAHCPDEETTEALTRLCRFHVADETGT